MQKLFRKLCDLTDSFDLDLEQQFWGNDLLVDT